MTARQTYRPWDAAWRDALYGPSGFYRRPEGPAGHFRTASHASPDVLGRALARLARSAGCTGVVDVGAGRGELLAAVQRADEGLDLLGVDVVARPAALPAGIAWAEEAPAVMSRTLLVGWELLDVVPCPVLEVAPGGGLRVVEVDDDGNERLAQVPTAQDLDWCERWWPGEAPGERVEVGRTRDALWGDLVDRVSDGLAVAVDYGHMSGGRPRAGTLAGYRRGRQVAPVPDGTCDVTAHVALDAVAAAAPGGHVTTQREALGGLGVPSTRAGTSPASSDPMAHLAALASSSTSHELLDAGGLGGFGWVVHARGERAGDYLAEWTGGEPA